MLKRLAIFALVTGLAAPALAQDDSGGGFISNMLENSLSGENRFVRVIGLEGALSSRATIQQITFADDQGVWLTISGAELDWQRASLLRGDLRINRLGAQSIEVARLPGETTKETELPSPEATPFRVPELPVSVFIGDLTVEKLVLDGAVVGVPAELKVTGDLTLDGGALDTGLSIVRLDRAGDSIDLTARFANETREIALDIAVNEAQGGLLSEALKIPGRPSVVFSAKGAGPVTDFTADITLDTDGERRIGGQVSLKGAEGSQDINFSADLSGDVSPLIAETYATFFGDSTAFALEGRKGEDGSLDIGGFELKSDALDVTGGLGIGADGKIARIALNGIIAPPGRETVVLPIGEPETSIRSARLELSLDASQGNDWSLRLDVTGLARDDMVLASAELTGDGTLEQGTEPRLRGTLLAGLQGLLLSDEALQKAIGPTITMAGKFDWTKGGALSLSDFAFKGDDYGAQIATLTLNGLESGFELQGEATVDAEDISRFADLAGQDIGGTVSAHVTGKGAPLGGSFDFRLDMTADDLKVGIEMVDPLIGGSTTLLLDAARDSTGMNLREFALNGTALSANATGTVTSSESNLTFDANLDDLGRILPQAPGPVTLDGTVTHQDQTASGQVRLRAPNETFADLEGTVEGSGAVDVTFKAGVTELDRFVQGLDGALQASGTAQRTEAAAWTVKATTGGTMGLTGAFDGTFDEKTGALQTTFDAAFERIERLVPQIEGTLSARGEAARSEELAWTFDAETGGTTGLSGRFAGGFDQQTGALDTTFDAAFERIERLVPQLQGTFSAKGRAARSDALQWEASAETGGTTGISGQFAGTYDEVGGAADLTFDAGFAELQRFVPQLPGSISARGTAQRSDQQAWTFDTETGGTAGISGHFDGSFDEVSGAADLTFDAALAQLDRLVPGIGGVLTARGRAQRSEELIWQTGVTTGGTAGISGSFRGDFDETSGAANLSFDTVLERLERLVPNVTGTLIASGKAERSEAAAWTAKLDTDGTAGIGGSFNGTFDEPTGAVDVFFDATFARLERLVPELTGALEAKGRVRRSAERGWQANSVTRGSAGISGTFKATYDEVSGDAEVYFDAALERVERFVSELVGTLSAAGVASKSGPNWTIDTMAQGPGGTNAKVVGSFDQDANRADVTAKGEARLGLANTAIRPNSLDGTARFDLALRGAPELASLSGSVTTSGASIAIPAVTQTVNNINATVNLANSRAQINATASLRAGGQFRVSGPIGLTPPFDAALTVQLIQLILTDNLSFQSSANGQLNFNGGLAGGGNLNGRVDFGPTEINVAAAGSFGAAPIPPITHVGESRPQFVTRVRAGLIEEERNRRGGSSSSGPSYGLGIVLNAPNRIFVRGRGLNAELGGSVSVGGTTTAPIPVGDISLIRGNFDILGRRLNLDEGQVTLQGDLEPFLHFVASTTTTEGEATLTLSGPASGPKIDVTSVPERPSDEALAMLLFGDKFTELSPLKIAQLGAEVAALAGRGPGFLGRIRKGLGLDNLDVGTDASGAAQVGVGAYLGDNVYTDVTVNAEGNSEVNLNFDLTDSLTIKGSVDNQGNTGIGLFFERDY